METRLRQFDLELNLKKTEVMLSGDGTDEMNIQLGRLTLK